MTDARFPERWLNDRRIIRLSNSAFRTFVLGMTWAVANRTDGYIARDDLDFIHGANPDDADELVKAGLWEWADDSGYWIEGFTKVQTSAAQLDGLEMKKQQDARRAKKYRDKKKDSPPDPNPPSSRDSSRDDIGQARTGQDRQDRTGAFDEEEVVTQERHVTPSTTSLPPEPCFSCGGDNPDPSSPICPSCTRGALGAPPPCARPGCSSPARTGKQMCQMHFTYEPSGRSAA